MSLSNCGHDERGAYVGGVAGDQTGTEWNIVPFYVYTGGWQYMIRHPNPEVGKLIAELAIEAANNNRIGYDQNGRETYWYNLADSNYRPSQITVACEADCSSGCIANVKAAGYILGLKELQRVSPDCYTGNIRAVLRNAGFEVYSDGKYLSSDKYLRPGDFLLKEGYHICTNVSTGAYSSLTTPNTQTSKWHATYRVQINDDRWLPEVVDLTDYAGIIGQTITGIAIKVSGGSVRYRVHDIGGDWNEWVTGYDINDFDLGYAGNHRPIDLVQIYFESPDGVTSAKYRVSPLNNNYYDWQTDTDVNSAMDGYAGDVGKRIDRLELYLL